MPWLSTIYGAATSNAGNKSGGNQRPPARATIRMKMIRYKSIKKTDTGYKYELLNTKIWTLNSAKFIRYNIITEYFSLVRGTLTGNMGYRWDGATGAIDSATFMESSCLHDILTDAIDAGMLPMSLWQAAANEMRAINEKEQMPWIRRQWTWAGVSVWGRVKQWLK